LGPMEVKTCNLYSPSLSELAANLQDGLREFYKNVAVTVERPQPELLDSWGVAASGLGGGINDGDATGAIVDIGGVNNIHFKANHDKNHWSVDNLAKYARICLTSFNI